MAVAMVGTPLALALGVPAGAFLGKLVNWRTTFLAMSGLALVLVVWIVWKMPDFPGRNERQRISVLQVFVTPGIRSILAVIFFWMVGHNILYTYIAPFIAQAGLGGRVDVVLLTFGVTALVGIWIIGLLVDRWLRPLVLVSLAGFLLTSFIFGVAGSSPFAVYAAVALWGLTFGGAATLLQTALADAAGSGIDLAQALNTTVWNLAIAGGGVAGGVLLSSTGAGSFAWVVLSLASFALLIVWQAKTHAFPSAAPKTAIVPA